MQSARVHRVHRGLASPFFQFFTFSTVSCHLEMASDHQPLPGLGSHVDRATTGPPTGPRTATKSDAGAEAGAGASTAESGQGASTGLARQDLARARREQHGPRLAPVCRTAGLHCGPLVRPNCAQSAKPALEKGVGGLPQLEYKLAKKAVLPTSSTPKTAAAARLRDRSRAKPRREPPGTSVSVSVQCWNNQEQEPPGSAV
ncbi:hypothetical protein NDU88_001036 [Pleurodeles waltl]|uniref:Uncharacterized protein n=1 Tax=Pleurodeles waltl TaxID=8319 RepID=A0AAV7R5W9_PLEWA|nr:hypothetical protein NDU88_001036 [Pleurodeles waltl]